MADNRTLKPRTASKRARRAPVIGTVRTFGKSLVPAPPEKLTNLREHSELRRRNETETHIEPDGRCGYNRGSMKPPAIASQSLPTAEELVERILRTVEGYDFSTFVLGFSRPDDYDREQHEEGFRQLKIEVGEELLVRLPGKRVDFEQPELRIDIRQGGKLDLKPAPMFLVGRYRKLSRRTQASRWIHHRCRGRGCPNCGYSGTLNAPSIQELLAPPVLRATGGTEEFFHGLGREDTDALMLERGRPFALEVRRPRRRRVPFREIQDQVAESGIAELLALNIAPASQARIVKHVEPDKTYRVWLGCHGDLPHDSAERAAQLAGRVIEQYSPRRVMHRRGRDTMRPKRVLESEWLGTAHGMPVWEVRVESGTYVKELVSGDGGRTRPNLSEVLGVDCYCDALDVLEIHWQPPWEE